MMDNIIDLAAWRAQHTKCTNQVKTHWRTMSEITRYKTLTPEEVLEYIAYAIWRRDLPDGFDGEITCEFNEDGSVEVYAVEQIEEQEEEEDSSSLN